LGSSILHCGCEIRVKGKIHFEFFDKFGKGVTIKPEKSVLSRIELFFIINQRSFMKVLRELFVYFFFLHYGAKILICHFEII
jgi:hypothetical protein